MKKKLQPPLPKGRGVYVDGGKVQIAVRLEPEAFKAVSEFAHQSNRSLSNAIYTLICEALNAH